MNKASCKNVNKIFKTKTFLHNILSSFVFRNKIYIKVVYKYISICYSLYFRMNLLFNLSIDV